jgi:diadenylate cyclase
MLPNIEHIFHGYAWYEIVVELAVIWIGVYLAMRFLRGTRGAGVIKGFVLLLIVLTVVVKFFGDSFGAFGRLNYIYDKFVGFASIMLIVVFQPELRQAMIRLGHARFFRRSTRNIDHVIEAVGNAVQFLSKSNFGALIAIERSIGLRGLTEGGVRLNADVSAQLLESIFWPNSPLHDLGVVIHADRIIAAAVQFPLAEQGMVGHDLGSRHRAALGLTMESDCLVVIVSEETGAISLAEHARLERAIPRDQIHEALRQKLTPRVPAPASDAGPEGQGHDAPSTHVITPAAPGTSKAVA